MLDHLSFAVNDMDGARVFYDAAFGALGYGRIMEMEFDGKSYCGYGDNGKPSFWIYGGYGPTAPQPGTHIAIVAPNRASIDAFHEAALAKDGKDCGQPGLRPEYHENYYAAFVVDPDGNKLEAVCHAPVSVADPSAST